jgi:hypothetical protein
MAATFYIPTKSNSVAHYFGKGIVLPSKFYTNKSEDLQDQFSNLGILLSLNKWVENSDCSIEVVLNDEETKSLIKFSEEFFLFQNPIPISRIKFIYFFDKDQKDTTLWNINNGTAFVPERMVEVESRQSVIFCSLEKISPHDTPMLSNEISEKIKRFDILLGGFAFMRIAGEEYMNFSTNFFSTLAYFNKLVEDELVSASNDGKIKIDNRYHGLFSKAESEWSKWFTYIFRSISPDDILQIAAKERVQVEKKLGFVKLESIPSDTHFYEVAVLGLYGDSKRKSIEDLIVDLHSRAIPKEKVEDVAIVFGLNSGYSRFRNKYSLGTSSDVVKFELKSKLDYYIIESVYQFALFGKKNNHHFEYLDAWIPNLPEQSKALESNEYKMLDALVVAKKKLSPLEEFLAEYSQGFFEAIIKSIEQLQYGKENSDSSESLLGKLFNVEQKGLTDFEYELKRTVFLKVEQEVKKLAKKYEDDSGKLLREISDLKSQVARSGIEPANPIGEEVVADTTTKQQETKVDFAKQKVTDLRKTARMLGMKDVSKKSKDELISFIRSNPSLIT